MNEVPANPLAWVNGSDAPEKSAVNLGFMALSDCAPVVVAATQGFAQPYGLTLNLKRQASWANLRDKLVSGEIDAAHSLYGLIYAVHLGIGGVAASDMAVLMGLNQNGQSINLSHGLQAQGVTNPEALERHVHQTRPKLTFAQTFPTGTHAMWLYYWLAAQGIHPLTDVDSVVVPPPQMIAHLQAGRIDGFCVGEPWCASAVKQNLGFTLATTQTIWPDHPEKVLGCTRAFVEQYPNTARALTMAVLDASRFIEASVENKKSTAQLIAGKAYVNAPVEVIEQRFLGHYDDGIGNKWTDEHPMSFCKGGSVNYPYLSDGMWFLTQFRRWGLLKEDVDYAGIAKSINQTKLYGEAASQLGLPVPGSPLRSSTLIDGKVWDGSNPAAYANSFTIKA